MKADLKSKLILALTTRTDVTLSAGEVAEVIKELHALQTSVALLEGERDLRAVTDKLRNILPG